MSIELLFCTRKKRLLTDNLMLTAFPTAYKRMAIIAKATYVPRIPLDVIVGKFLKNAFFLTDSPAYKIMGGKKNL